MTWTMTGEHTGLAAIVFRFVSMDTMIGPDFERGLVRLAEAAKG